MLVVDASCLFEVVTQGPRAEAIGTVLIADEEHAAPHLVDAEVVGLLRRDSLRGDLDETACRIALTALRDWPGERFGHQLLLERVWELRSDVRTWDALYVALAEALSARLVTLDERLSRAVGPQCSIVVPRDDR